MHRFAALLLLPACVLAQSDDRAAESIVALCEARWPEFAEPRMLCLNEQWSAYHQVKPFANNQTDGATAELYRQCASRWSPNFKLIADCLDEERRAVAPGDRVLDPAVIQCDPLAGIACIQAAIICGNRSASSLRYERLLKSTEKGKSMSAISRGADPRCST